MRFHSQTARRDPHRPAADEQRRARGVSGNGGRCWAGPSRSTPTRWTRRSRLPTEASVQLALRTQQVARLRDRRAQRERSPRRVLLPRVPSPTSSRPRAEAIFADIEKIGGVVRGIEMGWFQRQIAMSASRHQHEVEQKRHIVVGVNEFEVDEEGLTIPLLKIGAELEQEQVERMRKMRGRRNNEDVKRKLDALASAARAKPEHHPRHARLRPCVRDAVRDPREPGARVWQLTANRSSSRKTKVKTSFAEGGDVPSALAELLALGDDGWVVSCYQKLEPGDRDGSKYRIKLKNRLGAAVDRLGILGFERADRESITTALGSIEQFFSHSANLAGARGVAVFAGDGWLRAVRLPHVLRSRILIDHNAGGRRAGRPHRSGDARAGGGRRPHRRRGSSR